jgi:MFS family permease
MVASGHALDSAGFAIHWYVLAMFAPSFVTGSLIARYGRGRIVLTVLILLGLAGVVALSGTGRWQFNVAMGLFDLGWYLGYIGSTTIVTDCHRPEERSKV